MNPWASRMPSPAVATAPPGMATAEPWLRRQEEGPLGLLIDGNKTGQEKAYLWVESHAPWVIIVKNDRLCLLCDQDGEEPRLLGQEGEEGCRPTELARL